MLLTTRSNSSWNLALFIYWRNTAMDGREHVTVCDWTNVHAYLWTLHSAFVHDHVSRHSLSCMGCRHTTASTSNSPFWWTWHIMASHQHTSLTPLRQSVNSRHAIVYILLPLLTLTYHEQKQNSGRECSVFQDLLRGIHSLSLWELSTVLQLLKCQLKTHHFNIYLCRHF